MVGRSPGQQGVERRSQPEHVGGGLERPLLVLYFGRCAAADEHAVALAYLKLKQIDPDGEFQIGEPAEKTARIRTPV